MLEGKVALTRTPNLRPRKPKPPPGCNDLGLFVRPTLQRRPANGGRSETVIGKAKEAYGALAGDDAKKAEGRALQRKAEAEAEAEQRERTRQAEAEAKKAERQRDEQERKDKGPWAASRTP